MARKPALEGEGGFASVEKASVPALEDDVSASFEVPEPKIDVACLDFAEIVDSDFYLFTKRGSKGEITGSTVHCEPKDPGPRSACNRVELALCEPIGSVFPPWRKACGQCLRSRPDLFLAAEIRRSDPEAEEYAGADDAAGNGDE